MEKTVLYCGNADAEISNRSSRVRKKEIWSWVTGSWEVCTMPTWGLGFHAQHTCKKLAMVAFTCNSRAGEVTQWVKHLQLTKEDLSPQNPHMHDPKVPSSLPPQLLSYR